jgi:hypothetical protein
LRIFLDCDGVLADFDKKALEILGCLPRDFEGQAGEDSLWEKLYSVPEFFYSLEPMKDMEELVRGVEALGYFPTVLTGIPKPREHQLSSVPASDQKRKWVSKYLGSQYPVITCRSVNKCLSIKNPGDVLIDDWAKYMSRWQQHGGHFILHEYATDSLERLKQYLDEREQERTRNAWVYEKFEEIQEGLTH